MSDRIAIIGSGLTAVAAAKALIKRGVRPVILDYGEMPPNKIQAIVDGMSKINPRKWEEHDKKTISSNYTIHDKNGFPKKLSFGSDYFYGNHAKKNKNIDQNSNFFLPASLARGGLSVGWGGAVLPADDCDLDAWPIKNKDLSKYYRSLLSTLPFSAREDELSHCFPLYSDNYHPLELTMGNASLYSKFKKNIHKSKRYSAVFGQSRLLTHASSNKINQGCRYCGYCMSGCVYKSIYNARIDLDELIRNNLVDYEPGVYAHHLSENNQHVIVRCTNKNKDKLTFMFKRIFLGAGVVGTTRIILQSKHCYNHEVELLSTTRFVAPIWSFTTNHFDWPSVNTQAGIFLEYKAPNLSHHWIHAQISTPNELVLQKLKVLNKARHFSYLIRRNIAQHLFVANCNLHSDHGYKISMQLHKGNSLQDTTLKYQLKKNSNANTALKLARKGLSAIVRVAGCLNMVPFTRSGIGVDANHMGGTLPMKQHPTREFDTNIFGTPKDWERIHVVDSSIFPSIPGTTIGLLAMANAMRIADTVTL